jgi:hypothetical protein
MQHLPRPVLRQTLQRKAANGHSSKALGLSKQLQLKPLTEHEQYDPPHPGSGLC